MLNLGSQILMNEAEKISNLGDCYTKIDNEKKNYRNREKGMYSSIKENKKK